MYKLKPSSMSKSDYDYEMQFFNSEEERAAYKIGQMRDKFVNYDLLTEDVGEDIV